jgi:hypothetical protein
MSYTPYYNSLSIENVRENIERKNSSYPYFSNGKEIQNSVTDMDHHPYKRWFRGVYYYPDPVIIEREAGWRPLDNNCYKVISPSIQPGDPKHCYEGPCTTTYPCYPEYLAKYSDKDQLDVMLNKSCIVQYR